MLIFPSPFRASARSFSRVRSTFEGASFSLRLPFCFPNIPFLRQGLPYPGALFFTGLCRVRRSFGAKGTCSYFRGKSSDRPDAVGPHLFRHGRKGAETPEKGGAARTFEAVESVVLVRRPVNGAVLGIVSGEKNVARGARLHDALPHFFAAFPPE